MSDLDDKDFAVRAPYIQKILDLKSQVTELTNKLNEARLERGNKVAMLLLDIADEQLKVQELTEKLAAAQAEKPVGYIRAYGVDCLCGTLMNEVTGRIPLPSKTTIDPYPLAEDDISLYTRTSDTSALDTLLAAAKQEERVSRLLTTE